MADAFAERLASCESPLAFDARTSLLHFYPACCPCRTLHDIRLPGAVSLYHCWLLARRGFTTPREAYLDTAVIVQAARIYIFHKCSCLLDFRCGCAGIGDTCLAHGVDPLYMQARKKAPSQLLDEFNLGVITPVEARPDGKDRGECCNVVPVVCSFCSVPSTASYSPRTASCCIAFRGAAAC